ncbi:MAG: hypothetical protein QOH58_988 [Thermoleophilaceae bacterium]|nr:hypothetical protein [Thermoleophilaceae bacterium]
MQRRVREALRRHTELEDEEPREPREQEPAVEFPACEPPDVRTPPSFVVPYRRSVLIDPIPVALGDPIEGLPLVQIACVEVAGDGLELTAGVSVTLEQRWNLVRTALGDLASVIALAPGEDLTLEFTQSQRKVLDESTVESVESIRSDESTTLDKEVVDIARSSARTHNWHVDGSGSYGVGAFKIGASGGVSTSVSQSAQTSIQQVSETTRKSANSLKTLKKIEVHGVSEAFVQNRMTRRIRNPYPDRTLSVNVFQLIKHFSVLTDLAETRLALFIDVLDLDFDSGFVVAHGDFLRANLLDSALLDELPLAIQGAQPEPPARSQQEVTAWAERALAYLFDEPNVFNVPGISVGPLGPPAPVDPNAPSSSFDAQIYPDESGFDDALRNELGVVFTSLNVFFRVYEDLKAASQLDQNALALALALADDVGAKWTGAPPDRVQNVLDVGSYTEIFRRLSGFLAIVANVLKPLVQPAESDLQALAAREQGIFALSRLLRHLNCNENYYIQRLLAYLAQSTKSQAIVDFVNVVLDRAALPPEVRARYDVERSFVSRQQVVVPGVRRLRRGVADRLVPATAANGDGEVTPSVDEVEVPADGIHLEVAAGACVLDGVPTAPQSAEISVEGVELRVTGGSG